MKLDETKLKVIGFDRVKIYVELISVNTDKNPNAYGIATEMATLGYKVFNEATNDYCKLNSFKFKKIITGENIEENDKDNIIYGLELSRDKRKVILDIVLPRMVYGTIHNVYNVSNKEEVTKAMEMLIIGLGVEGIEINPIEEWEVFSLEVNKTIVADEPLIYYRKDLNWLFDEALDKGYVNEISEYRKRLLDNDISDTLRFDTKRIKGKIYSKSSQIKDQLKLFVEENLIRLELTYDKEAIQRAFGYNGLYDIFDKDKMEKSYNKATSKLIKYLNEFTEEKIRNLERKFECANYKAINKVYKENITDIYDILFLVEASRRVYKKEKNNKFSRDIKKLLKSYDRSLENRYNELRKILIAFNDTIEATNFDNVEKYLPKNK